MELGGRLKRILQVFVAGLALLGVACTAYVEQPAVAVRDGDLIGEYIRGVLEGHILELRPNGEFLIREYSDLPGKRQEYSGDWKLDGSEITLRGEGSNDDRMISKFQKLIVVPDESSFALVPPIDLPYLRDHPLQVTYAFRRRN